MHEVLFSSLYDSKAETSGGGYVFVVWVTEGFVVDSVKIRIWNGKVVWDWDYGSKMNFERGGIVVAVGTYVVVGGGGGDWEKLMIASFNIF